MGFGGATDKCKACNKTVYFIELVTADGVSYHKTCFRCSRCNGRLVMGNYCSMGGALYCKPHFEQLLKESGCTMKNFQPRKSEKQNGLARAPSRLASYFSGTVDKCRVCNKTAYPLEKVTVEGENYHKSCFRCSPGGCVLTPTTYAKNDGILYCKHHFAQMFMKKGCYFHLTKQTSLKKNSAISSPKAALEPEVDEPQQPKAAQRPNKNMMNRVHNANLKMVSHNNQNKQ